MMMMMIMIMMITIHTSSLRNFITIQKSVPTTQSTTTYVVGLTIIAK
jgi:hypothetical protein